MPATVPWQPMESTPQVLRHLQAGACVALPTESTYELVAAACLPEAVDRLGRVASPGEVPAIVLSDFPRLVDWLPWVSGGGERLFWKLGPGPYTYRGNSGCAHGLAARLPASVRGVVVSDEHLALRWPEHPIWSELAHADVPLVCVPVPGAVDAATTASQIGAAVGCIVDAGPTQHRLPPSIVDAVGRRCRLMRPGALTAEHLDLITCCRILFVCTGNTCRSPMAEALCVKLLTERLGCSRSDLMRHGFHVQSMGLAAMMGEEASSEAVQVAAEMGADLAQHRSSPASLEMLQSADFVFAMTAGHWHMLKGVDVPGLPTPRMLSPRFEDIADPIGRALNDYRSCANQILECLQQRLPEILES